jgi:hypothetical protein
VRWIIGVFAVEAITEIIIHSELLDRPRNALKKIWFFDKLLSCGWCASFWTAVIVFGIISAGWQIILVPIVIHRASNFLHLVYSWIKKNRWRA